MNTNEFLQKYRRKENEFFVFARPRMVCADGFSVSVQAGYGLYSDPREDSDYYNAVELGYPSKEDSLITPYAESLNNPTGTVYGMVPVEVVDSLIKKHGGLIGIDRSNDALGIWSDFDEDKAI